MTTKEKTPAAASTTPPHTASGPDSSIFVQLPPSLSSPEYLRPHSLHKAREKGWGERLTFEVGVCYLFGIFSGGAVGAFQGYRSTPDAKNFALTKNSILNQSGRLGASTANGFAVFALLFSFSRTALKYRRKKTDSWNDIGGIAIAGTLCTIPKTLPTALATGALLGTGSYGAIWAGRRLGVYGGKL